MIRQFVAGAFLLAASQYASASGGPLDEKGCHIDPATKKYHCHNSPIERPEGSTGVIEVSDTAVDDKKDDTLFADCKEVRELGYAPLKLGQPGYSRRLDPDGDGLACD